MSTHALSAHALSAHAFTGLLDLGTLELLWIEKEQECMWCESLIGEHNCTKESDRLIDSTHFFVNGVIVATLAFSLVRFEIRYDARRQSRDGAWFALDPSR